MEEYVKTVAEMQNCKAVTSLTQVIWGSTPYNPTRAVPRLLGYALFLVELRNRIAEVFAKFDFVVHFI